jgi:hypothetical protein
MLTITLVLTAKTASASSSYPQSGPELDLTMVYDSNRTLGDKLLLQGVYNWQLTENCQLQAGLSFDTDTNSQNASFLEFGTNDLFYNTDNDSKLGIHLKFLGNQYGEYGKAANSIIPYLSWENPNYLINFGLNYRFLVVNRDQLYNIFYFNTSSYEIIPYCRFCYHINPDNQRYSLNVEINNADDFYAGNLGSYGLFFKGSFMINDKVTIFGDLGFRQSGSIALSATFYKTIISGGFEVKL